MNAATNKMIECPKCFGSKRFSRFAHIVGGDCFLCGAAGKVTEAEAASWLGSQHGSTPAPKVTKNVQTVREDGTKRKIVDVPGLGECKITRYTDGDMRVDVADAPGDLHSDGERLCGLWLIIRVVDGQIRVQKQGGSDFACYGLTAYPERMQRYTQALQRALKR